MSVRVFMKRLAHVEIDPARSNQRELHAGRLRKELGLRGDRCQGAIEYLFYVANDAHPVVVRSGYTLSNVRRNKPRSAEWRMYYKGYRAVAKHARANDLMLLFRLDVESNDLTAVIARQGTNVERSLTRQLAGVDPEELVDARFVDSKTIDPETRRLLLRVRGSREKHATIDTYAPTSHPLFQRASAQARMPTTAEMASAALDIVKDIGITEGQPDEFIDLALRTETVLFFAIEEMLGNRELAQLQLKGDLDFHAAMRLTLSFQQSRRSRRGQSLENHFLSLLERLKIPFGYQCITEPGQKPDFIFPSCDHYRDPTYPSDKPGSCNGG